MFPEKTIEWMRDISQRVENIEGEIKDLRKDIMELQQNG